MNSNTAHLCECIFRGLLQDLTRKGADEVPLHQWSRKAIDQRFIADLGLLGKYLDSLLAAGFYWNWENFPIEIDLIACDDDARDFVHDVILSLRASSQHDTIKYVRQMTHVFAKLELPHEKTTETEAFLGLRNRNSDLGSFWTSDRRANCRGNIDAARTLVRSLFCRYSQERIAPCHGPGAVAGGEKGIQKMSFSYCDSPRFPFYEWFFLSPSHVCDDGLRNGQPIERGNIERISRAIAVPKDFRGPRIICAEPKELQWLQQGVWRSVSSLIEDHAVVSECIDFYDQSKNGMLALSASRDGSHVTIDLSEASDRIAIDLIYLLFFKNGRADDFYRDYLACRSRHVRLPDGTLVKLRMATTMGSALCFPLQSVVFLALVYQSMVDHHRGMRVRSLIGKVRVFGDDIIVPRDDANYVIATLTSFGLKINTSKTCIGPSFKESCGVDAFKGINVTPIRLKTTVGKHINGVQLLALCATQQRLHNAGYQMAARALAVLLKNYDPRIPGIPARLSERAPMSVICSDTYIDAPRRWDRKIHCWVYRCLTTIVKTKVVNNAGWNPLLLAMSKAGRRPAYMHKARGPLSYKATWLRLS